MIIMIIMDIYSSLNFFKLEVIILFIIMVMVNKIIKIIYSYIIVFHINCQIESFLLFKLNSIIFDYMMN